ncbi:MAG TPA: transglycosylase domain-containing protein, partial [Longimicrobiaceae bacterium]
MGIRGRAGRWGGAAACAAVLLSGAVLLRPDAGVERLAREAPLRTGYMRHRAALNGLPEDAYRLRWTSLDSISPLLAGAVIKAEDRGFFRHGGFEWRQM